MLENINCVCEDLVSCNLTLASHTKSWKARDTLGNVDIWWVCVHMHVGYEKRTLNIRPAELAHMRPL